MHVSNTHLYSPNSACAWGFLLCLRVGSPLAKTCSLPICFEIQHCSSPGCLSHRVQIEKDALSTAASHEAPVHKRARQDCKQKRIFSTGASREAPVDKRARQDCNQKRSFLTGTPLRFSSGASREAPVDNECFSIWQLGLGTLNYPRYPGDDGKS